VEQSAIGPPLPRSRWRPVHLRRLTVGDASPHEGARQDLERRDAPMLLEGIAHARILAVDPIANQNVRQVREPAHFGHAQPQVQILADRQHVRGIPADRQRGLSPKRRRGIPQSAASAFEMRTVDVFMGEVADEDTQRPVFGIHDEHARAHGDAIGMTVEIRDLPAQPPGKHGVVAVEVGDERPARLLQPDVSRDGRRHVGMIDDADARVSRRRARGRIGRTIRRGAIDEDEQLEVAKITRQDALDGFSDESLAVEHGHHHRHARRHRRASALQLRRRRCGVTDCRTPCRPSCTARRHRSGPAPRRTAALSCNRSPR
jgi:hypothetical protein